MARPSLSGPEKCIFYNYLFLTVFHHTIHNAGSGLSLEIIFVIKQSTNYLDD